MTDDHLSIDELAELDEGLLSADRISAIRAHLHGCDECQAKADAITNARTALSALPPVTMPADVRARIDEALAAEAADTSDPVELSVVPDSNPRADNGPRIVTGPIDREPEVDPLLRSPDVMPTPGNVVRGRFGRPTAASSAAAAALVLAVGAVVVAHYHHGSSAQPGITSGDLQNLNHNPELSSQAPSPLSLVQEHTGAHYSATNLKAQVQSLLKLNPTTGTLSAPATPSPSATTGGSTVTGSKGSGGGATKTSAKGLSSTARKHASPPAPSAVQNFSNADSVASIPKVLRPLAKNQPRILECAVKIAADPSAVPEYVDFGRWSDANVHNAPSAIFVFLGATPDTRIVYVTNPTCSGQLPIRTIQQISLSN